MFLLAGLFRFLFGCHGCLFSLPLFMDNVHGSCNDDLLQLSECIESKKSEVKQKMMFNDECNGVRRSPRELHQDFLCVTPRNFQRTTTRSSNFSAFKFQNSSSSEMRNPRQGLSKLGVRNLKVYLCRSARRHLPASI